MQPSAGEERTQSCLDWEQVIPSRCCPATPRRLVGVEAENSWSGVHRFLVLGETIKEASNSFNRENHSWLFWQSRVSISAVFLRTILHNMSDAFTMSRPFNPLILCLAVQSLSLVQLFCDPMDCSPPGSSVHGISKARMLEWVAISFSRGSSQPRD